MPNSTQELLDSYGSLTATDKIDLIGAIERKIAGRKEFLAMLTTEEASVFHIAGMC